MIGYQVGDRNYSAADRTCMYSLKAALAIAMPISIAAIFFRCQLIMVFTADPAVVAPGAALFFIDIFLTQYAHIFPAITQGRTWSPW